MQVQGQVLPWSHREGSHPLVIHTNVRLYPEGQFRVGRGGEKRRAFKVEVYTSGLSREAGPQPPQGVRDVSMAVENEARWAEMSLQRQTQAT